MSPTTLPPHCLLTVNYSFLLLLLSSQTCRLYPAPTATLPFFRSQHTNMYFVSSEGSLCFLSLLRLVPVQGAHSPCGITLCEVHLCVRWVSLSVLARCPGLSAVKLRLWRAKDSMCCFLGYVLFCFAFLVVVFVVLGFLLLLFVCWLFVFFSSFTSWSSKPYIV